MRSTTILLLLLLPLLWFSTHEDNTYEIEWSLVPEKPEPPQKTQTESFGTCVCDLTFHECDPNCCCDSDCTEEHLLSYVTSLVYL